VVEVRFSFAKEILLGKSGSCKSDTWNGSSLKGGVILAYQQCWWDKKLLMVMGRSLHRVLFSDANRGCNRAGGIWPCFAACLGSWSGATIGRLMLR
jgi:hypothetical protein